MKSLAEKHAEPAMEGNAFYRRALQLLNESKIPYLVGGAYALAHYTGVARDTKDIDIFVRPHDCQRVLDWFGNQGFRAELTFPHWLGKVFYSQFFLDVIFSSGNGIATVDDRWFSHSVPAELMGEPARFCPVEEMIWSKSYIQERERFDGADIHHLLRARGTYMDWTRLLERFGDHWRILFGHLVVFGFVYPRERAKVPNWVMQDLVTRLKKEPSDNGDALRVCQGTLLSREQYLIDVDEWGYEDAREEPQGNMSAADIRHWTAAIDEKK